MPKRQASQSWGGRAGYTEWGAEILGLLCGTAWDVTESRLRASSRNSSFDRWRHETDCRSGPVGPRRSRAPVPGRSHRRPRRLWPGTGRLPGFGDMSLGPARPPGPRLPEPGTRRASPETPAAGSPTCAARAESAQRPSRPVCVPSGWVKLTRCVAQGSGKSREPSKPDGTLKPFFGALPPAPLPPCSSRSPLRVGWAQGAAAPHPGGLGLRF